MSLAARPLPVLAAAVVACAGIVLAATLIAAPLGEALADWSAAWQETLFALILYGVLALIAVIGRRLAAVKGQGGAVLPWLALGLALGIGGFLVAVGDTMLAGSLARGSAAATPGVLLLGTLVVVGQSASEELFFRGWLQPVLVRGWGAVAGIGVTALAFAALHVAGGARAPLTLVNLAVGGVLFGLLAQRGGLAAAVAAHAGWNWAEGILFGLDPNPGAGGFGAIHDLDLLGPARWGGSAEGMNGSVAMTLVLVALALPLAVRLSDAPALRTSTAPG